MFLKFSEKATMKADAGGVVNRHSRKSLNSQGHLSGQVTKGSSPGPSGAVSRSVQGQGAQLRKQQCAL